MKVIKKLLILIEKIGNLIVKTIKAFNPGICKRVPEGQIKPVAIFSVVFEPRMVFTFLNGEKKSKEE